MWSKMVNICSDYHNMECCATINLTCIYTDVTH
nr:MAG TPA: hypothetical protein [Caudoviricetes sp.]DAG07481.1 MAG TPA: hypothetical protein [Bacteriophage sp.]DAQ34985.1 MAG TPA: hypothetical protein [Bacteriophage sp.]DAR53327.1 MAG TPA: hypothetical protein [Caudoviricetes sp.]